MTFCLATATLDSFQTEGYLFVHIRIYNCHVITVCLAENLVFVSSFNFVGLLGTKNGPGFCDHAGGDELNIKTCDGILPYQQLLR